MSQLLCKGVQKLLGKWFFEAALLSKSKRAAMCEKTNAVQVILGKLKVGRTEKISQFKVIHTNDR